MSYCKKRSELTVLLLMLLVIYIISNLDIIGINKSSFYANIGKPVLWLTCAAAVLFTFTAPNPIGKLRIKNEIIILGVVISILYIMFQIIGGILEGFGRSPYSFTPTGLIINTWVLFSTLISKELVRQSLVYNLGHKNYFVPISITAFIMTCMEIQLFQLSTLNSNFRIINFIGSSLLPVFFENVLASYLAYLAGFKASLCFMGIQKAFHWYCPILPDLDCITRSLIGVCVLLFSIMLIQFIYSKQIKTKKIKTIKRKDSLSTAVICAISILLVWFSAGIFPVYPSIIATGSMIPACYPGDIVLYKKIKPGNIYEGDIVQFMCEEKVTITHRVKEIINSNATAYRTKGDNNSIPDSDLVYPEQIKGKVVYVIPKLGWFSLFFRDITGHDTTAGKYEF